MSRLFLLFLFLTLVFADVNRNNSANRRSFSRRIKTAQIRHRHSTKVVRNKPTLILLPPFDDKLEITTSSPFVMNLPSGESTTTSTTTTTTTTSTTHVPKLSLNELILPPFNYLLPPYLDLKELRENQHQEISIDSTLEGKNESLTTLPTERTNLNVTNLAFFVADLFDFPSANLTSLDAITEASLVPFNATSNDFVNDKNLEAQETGDFRNQLLLEEDEINNNEYNSYPQATTELPRLKNNSTKNSSKFCGNRLGYVADVSNGCQTFYICTEHGMVEPMSCPNGTLFSQDFLVCDWWYNVECVE